MSLVRFAADENFNNTILRGLARRQLSLDIVRIQDTDMYQADDPKVLAWCQQENRILLTHDIRTIPKYAYERIEAGHRLLVCSSSAINWALDKLLTILW